MPLLLLLGAQGGAADPHDPGELTDAFPGGYPGMQYDFSFKAPDGPHNPGTITDLNPGGYPMTAYGEFEAKAPEFPEPEPTPAPVIPPPSGGQEVPRGRDYRRERAKKRDKNLPLHKYFDQQKTSTPEEEPIKRFRKTPAINEGAKLVEPDIVSVSYDEVAQRIEAVARAAHEERLRREKVALEAAAAKAALEEKLRLENEEAIAILLLMS